MNEEKNSRNQEKGKLSNNEKNYISTLQREMEIISGLVQNNTRIINMLRNFHITLIGALLGVLIYRIAKIPNNEGISQFLKSNPAIIIVLIVITLFFAMSEGIVTGWQISHINRLSQLDEIVNKNLKLEVDGVFISKEINKNHKYISWICETIKVPSFLGYYVFILVSLGLFYLYVEGFTISLYSVSLFLIGLVVGFIICCLLMRKK